MGPDSHLTRLSGTGRQPLVRGIDAGARTVEYLEVSNNNAASIVLTVVIERDGQDYPLADAVTILTKEAWLWGPARLNLRPRDVIVAYLATAPTTEPTGIASFEDR